MKLITMGCSVTYFPGVKEKLASLLNVELLNLSQPAGSNELQINKLHESIISNSLDKDDIVYWQITSVGRKFDRLNKHFLKEAVRIQEEKFDVGQPGVYHYVMSKENVFDSKPRIDLLCHSPMATRLVTMDIDQRLQTLLATIIMLSKFIPKILIVFGWKSIMSDNQCKIFKKYLTEFNISYVDESYVDYAVLNRLEMMDDMHPAESAGDKFAMDIVYPKIISLKWI